MSQYVSVAEFQARSIVPPELIAWVNNRNATWLDAQLTMISGYLDGRLRKRYVVPLQSVPETVKLWVTSIVTRRLYEFRGVDPTDAQFASIKAEADRAMLEIKEAADAEEGLYDLPLTAATGSASAATKGGPFVYSETSPYVGFDVQREIARQEDLAGYGT